MRIVHDETNSDLIVSLGEEAKSTTIYAETTMEFRSKRGIIYTAAYEIWHYQDSETPGAPDDAEEHYRGSFNGSKHLSAQVAINTEGWLDA